MRLVAAEVGFLAPGPDTFVAVMAAQRRELQRFATVFVRQKVLVQLAVCL